MNAWDRRSIGKPVFGRDLQIGDVIEVWWRPYRDVIIDFEPYTGPLAYLFPDGARIATFGICRGMTVGNDERYSRVWPPQ